MSDTKLLDGRSALVTGAASGIGKAIAKALAGAGAWVAVSDKDGAAAAALAQEIGSDAIAAELDVTDATATAKVFEQAETAFGRIDIVCANAGISTMNATVDLTEAEWDSNMNVNAKGVFLTNQAAVRLWLAANPGDAQAGGQELAGQLAREFENGRKILLRLTLAREVMRSDRMSLDRELQVLNGIRGLCAKPPVSLSCRG